MDYMTTIEVSRLWEISSRRIIKLCNEGRVDGAIIRGHTWLIPKETEKPIEQKRGPKREIKMEE